MLCDQRKVHDPFLLASPIFSEWLLWHHSKEQECIPAGCVPPTAMTVSPATHASPTHVPCHASPPPLPCMFPLPCMPLCYAYPTAMHAPAMHTPLPCTTPSHACPPATYARLATHAPCHACPPSCRQNSWHLWKHYLAATSLRAVKKGSFDIFENLQNWDDRDVKEHANTWNIWTVEIPRQ